MAEQTKGTDPLGTKYGRLSSDRDYRTGTEFGGLPGVIQQPTVHELTAVDRLRQVYQTNPAGNWPAGTHPDDQPVPDTSLIQK